MLNGFDRKVEEMKMKGESNFYATPNMRIVHRFAEYVGAGRSV
jgi:hypothetical protein